MIFQFFQQILFCIFWAFSIIRSYFLNIKVEKKLSQMEPEAKRQKTDDISSVQTISLVWLDNSNETSEENIAIQQQLRSFDSNLKLFKDDNTCEEYVTSQSSQSIIILIVNGGLGQKIVPRVHGLSQIISIYVYCWDKERHEKWANEFTKVKGIVTQFNDLKDKIQIDHFRDNPPTVNESINYRQSAGTYEFDNQYIIADISIEYVSQMKATSNEKDAFLFEYQAIFNGQPQRMAILQEFQESYSSDRAVSWFSRDPFFYQILENIFQLANTTTMYLYRFFIRDIQKQFEKEKFTSPIHAYRGQLMSDENLRQLKNPEGKVIVFKMFLSTTLNRDIAMAFIPDQTEQKRVLFEIEANPQIEGVKPFIKTSSDLNDECDVLFMLGSLFQINEIRDDENGITIVKMTLCTNENYNSMKNQLYNTNEEKDFIGFAQLQCNMSKMLGQSEILDGVDKLLEEYLNEIPDDHPDRIRCFDTLGNITFAKNDFDSSLSWYQKSLEMTKKNLPLNSLKLAECYNNIAFVYLKKSDNTQALDVFKEVLIIWKQVYGTEHHNLIPCYLHMVTIYELEEKFIEVLLCYNQIIGIMLKHYPIDDVNLAPIYNNMGKTFASLNQYPLALGYYETSLNIKLKNSFPPDSTALAHKSVGFIYKDMGNVNQARIHLEKAAEIYRQLYPSTHESILETEQVIQNISSSSQ